MLNRSRPTAILHSALFGFAVCWGACLPSGGTAAAETCAAEEFSREVDAAGAALRGFNAEMAPKLQSRIRDLKSAKGWKESEFQNLAQDHLFDKQTAEFDSKANELLDRLDELGSTGELGGADCAKLKELKTTGTALLDVMRKKSAYTLAKIDNEIAAGRDSSKTAVRGSRTSSPTTQADARHAAATAAKPKPQPEVKVKPKKAKVIKKPPSQPLGPEPEDVAMAGPLVKPGTDRWETVTQSSTATPSGVVPPGGDIQVLQPPPGAFAGPNEGYSVEEIRDATRGFFGTISTNLATVIEHAFGKWGQPTAYVLGKEGGGAFLAGVRYGKGTLFMRSGAVRKVYWHGPSLGYDFGAEGSRTLFLIYALKNPGDIHRSFTGVDGSAYLVGGVGVTLLKGGPVILAPIRSGLGLRLGANIGYVRFTPEPTWNPF
jgi:hypothetical protein